MARSRKSVINRLKIAELKEVNCNKLRNRSSYITCKLVTGKTFALALISASVENGKDVILEALENNNSILVLCVIIIIIFELCNNIFHL